MSARPPEELPAGKEQNRSPAVYIGLLVLLYFGVFFPLCSYLVRHDEFSAVLVIYRPLPQSVRTGMFKSWLRLNSDGLLRRHAPWNVQTALLPELAYPVIPN